MTRPIKLLVNGQEHSADVEPSWSLAQVLRDKLRLTGTKIGCASGSCGTCTVLLEGVPVFSCLKLAVEVEGKEVTTIEGLAEDDRLHPIQTSFVNNHGMQCGFCTPGMILAAKGLLDQNPEPTERDVREAIGGHLCRCGTYPRIVKSILSAAQSMKESENG